MRRKGSRKESSAELMRQSEPWRNRGLQTEQIRSAVRRDRATDPDAAFVLEPFSPSTLAAVYATQHWRH